MNILILEEFLNFLYQNLFINIDDSNGQSNHTDVIKIQDLKLLFDYQYQIIYSCFFL